MSKLLLALLFAVVAFVSPVFANEEEHVCKTDADCAEGEHCKDGHCHAK